MLNYKLIIQYDGTRYKGWQKQKNTETTIQGKIEEVLTRLLNQEISINGSGRTDAGVHALAQVANFHFDETLANISSYSPCQVKDALNSYLPNDIRILSCEEVNPRFHARLNAKSKIYEYRIDNTEIGNIFERKYLTRIEKALNTDKMIEASKYFIGTHDFKSFSTNTHIKKSTIRTIYDIKIVNKDGIISMEFFGNGFLYNMVRIISGMLIDVGLGKYSPDVIPELLEAKDRTKVGGIAPASGLFLVKVNY